MDLNAKPLNPAKPVHVFACAKAKQIPDPTSYLYISFPHSDTPYRTPHLLLYYLCLKCEGRV